MFSSPRCSGQEINAVHRIPAELNMWKHGQDDTLVNEHLHGVIIERYILYADSTSVIND